MIIRGLCCSVRTRVRACSGVVSDMDWIAYLIAAPFVAIGLYAAWRFVDPFRRDELSPHDEILRALAEVRDRARKHRMPHIAARLTALLQDLVAISRASECKWCGRKLSSSQTECARCAHSLNTRSKSQPCPHGKPPTVSCEICTPPLPGSVPNYWHNP